MWPCREITVTAHTLSIKWGWIMGWTAFINDYNSSTQEKLPKRKHGVQSMQRRCAIGKYPSWNAFSKGQAVSFDGFNL